LYLGQFEKSLQYNDKATRLSPHDPSLAFWYQMKTTAYFGLKQYDQAIDWARKTIAINPNNNPLPHFNLIASLALAGHEAEAHEALERYLGLVPFGPKTIVAWKAVAAPFTEHGDPLFLEMFDREIGGLRKVGVPEK
jgi:adenylate cyclase